MYIIWYMAYQRVHKEHVKARTWVYKPLAPSLPWGLWKPGDQSRQFNALITMCTLSVLFVLPRAQGRPGSQRWANAGLMLDQRRKRRANIKPAFSQNLAFAGIKNFIKSSNRNPSIQRSTVSSLSKDPCLTVCCGWCQPNGVLMLGVKTKMRGGGVILQ